MLECCGFEFMRFVYSSAFNIANFDLHCMYET